MRAAAVAACRLTHKFAEKFSREKNAGCKLQMEDKFGRRRPMFLPIYHGQTCCRISIERLAMRKGSLICVPSLRRLCFLGASFKLGFMPVSRRSTAKLSFHFRHHGQTSFRIRLCVCIFTPLLPQKHGQTSFRIRPIFSSIYTGSPSPQG